MRLHRNLHRGWHNPGGTGCCSIAALQWFLFLWLTRFQCIGYFCFVSDCRQPFHVCHAYIRVCAPGIHIYMNIHTWPWLFVLPFMYLLQSLFKMSRSPKDLLSPRSMDCLITQSPVSSQQECLILPFLVLANSLQTLASGLFLVLDHTNGA